MFVTILMSMVLTLQDPAIDPLASLPVLQPGNVLAGVIDSSDPVIETERLRTNYGFAPARGKTYRVTATESTEYRIRAESAFFRPYLVVRNRTGAVLAENDYGHLGILPEVIAGLEANEDYVVEVASLYGHPGPYTVTLEAYERNSETVEDPQAAALAYAENGLKAVEEAAGETPSAALGIALHRLAYVLKDPKERRRRIRLYKRAIRTWEIAVGAEHPLTAMSLGNLGGLLDAQGNYAAARPLYERALRINEAALGSEHPGTARAMNSLAVLLDTLGDYAAARPLYERALRIRETALGPEDPATAVVLNNLAMHFNDQGEYAAARPLYERAFRIWETALGPEHPRTATSLNNLAALLNAQGDYAAARPLFERALRIRETALGPEHPGTASCLNNLAHLLDAQGDYAAARPLYERALRINETALGPEHYLTALSLNNLALVLRDQGDYAAARPLFERALRINETSLGSEHRHVALGLQNLALVLHAQGDHAAARAFYERALRIWETTLGPEHPETARTLNNLATLVQFQGDYAAARSLYERALRIRETALGAEHRLTTQVMNILAMLRFDLGESDDSLALSERAIQSNQVQRLRLAWSLTESERLLFAERQRLAFRTFLSIAKRGSKDNQFAAYEALLQWKAQVLRSLAQSRGQSLAGLSQEDQARVDTLGRLQARLSKELFNKSVEDREAHQALLASLRAERQRLELELNRSLGASEDETPVSIDELARALPTDSVLIDFLVHPIYTPARRDGDTVTAAGYWTEPHLSAWVLRAGDKTDLRWMDLGEAAPIEQATKAFLENLVASRGIAAVDTEDGPSPADRANDTLRSLLWDPLRKQIGDAKHVFVSPDSFLGTLPFEVLRQDDESYLIETFAFVYLQDAASLATRLRSPAVAKSPSNAASQANAEQDTVSLLCIGGVDYRRRADLAWREAIEESTNEANRIEDTPSDSLAIEGLASADAANAAPSSQLLARADVRAGFMNRWSPLPATRDEAIAIADLHEEAFEDGNRVVLQKRDATEERIKYELPRHRILHLATHGFFQPKGLPSMWEQAQKRGGGTEMVMREEEKRLAGLLPGLLSGLVLAGANRAAPTANRDDGLLTAEEISFLDLSNVDLVVLSACESGLGRPQGGEGMLGFRRTFRAAGAKTVISSLWKVSDEATNELMQSFYERLWLDGESKQTALRAAQLDMLKRNRIENDGDALPSTWGAFVLDGAWE